MVKNNEWNIQNIFCCFPYSDNQATICHSRSWTKHHVGTSANDHVPGRSLEQVPVWKRPGKAHSHSNTPPGASKCIESVKVEILSDHLKQQLLPAMTNFLLQISLQGSDDSCRCLGVTSLFQNIFMSHMTESQGNPKESYNFEMERHLSLGNIKVKNWKYFEILNDEWFKNPKALT